MLNLIQSNPCCIFTFPESVIKQTDGDSDDDDDDEDDEDDDSEVKEENGVLILNDANFDTFTADKDTVLLEFYAPWWVHSLSLVHLRCRMRWLSGASFTGHSLKK